MSKTNVFDILAMSTVNLAPGEIGQIRRRSLPCFAAKLTPQLLKHSDEQTLASLAALAGAVEQCGAANRDFGDWAVVSSSRYLGRSAFATVLDKYESEGPWGVSVQVIPHRIGHAVSGTISLGLGSHGPCIGAGGACGGETDAVATVAGLLNSGQCPAAWVVFSAWLPELAIDRSGRPTSEAVCAAAALAILPASSSALFGQIRIGELNARYSQPTMAPGGHCLDLTEFFTDPNPSPRTWHQSLGGKLHCEVNLVSRATQESTILGSEIAASLAAGLTE
jgi:hypothetical protein